MQAHKLKVRVRPDHRVSFDLPVDFPVGEAEVIVLTSHAAVRAVKPPASSRAGEDFSVWLGKLLDGLPSAPVLPAEAFDRASIYED